MEEFTEQESDMLHAHLKKCGGRRLEVMANGNIACEVCGKTVLFAAPKATELQEWYEES